MAQITSENQSRAAYLRFAPTQRFEHMVLLVTFTGLALTGLPQRYADTNWAQIMIGLMGGIEGIRIVHRVLATILMAEAIFHGGVISYKLLVLGQKATMMPGKRDLRDTLHWILYNLGLRREHPKMPRYNFGEKAEYLAVIWGTVIMIITGFMMWNPIATVKFFPGEFIPAALAAHSGEALLAVLAIIVWHMYNVHFRRFNRSIFNGHLSHEEMQEEHAEELEQIEQGQLSQLTLPPSVLKRRKRFFWPYAIVMTIMLTLTLFYFVTLEQTALTTLPLRQTSYETDIDPSIGSLENGAQLWDSLDCKTCHGEQLDGGDSLVGVSLTELNITYDALVEAVRLGPADMPGSPPAKISDEELADIWVWYVCAKIQCLGSS